MDYKILEIIKQEMECKGSTMDCIIKIHIFINFIAKKTGFLSPVLHGQ